MVSPKENRQDHELVQEISKRYGYESGRACVMLKQDENKNNDAVMIIEGKDGKIKRCDLCAPELFDPEPTDLYPI